MQSYYRQHKHLSIATQGGFMPSYWLAINSVSLSNDRTPEGYISSGLIREGWDG